MADNNMMGKVMAWRTGRLGFKTTVVTLLCILLNILALYLLRRLFPALRGGGDHRHTHGSRRRSSSRDGNSKKKHKKHHGNEEVKNSLPNLLLLLGIPGSGKTTWINQYIDRCDKSYIVLNEDSVAGKVVAAIDDSSWEEGVREAFIGEIVRHLNEKQNVVLDDSLRVMDEEFRRSIMEAAPPCNLLVKEFPIKALFAHARLLKVAEEVTDRRCPTEIEMEELETNFEKARACMKTEGWKQLLDPSHLRSKHR
ncbi:hypothetical protein C3747_29g122 [Trypanosoma cruzi]|uniref:Retrotransposon hot spot (RHS) protein n=1 Tax=Trypanosoma cruzi TaxID=5693 RepID=A0A2V2X3W4_TRYCR|nr:hypothetical protein TcYC6_0090270 [Trypanosoma cruzi]PWV15487.1 hypothetical protein C3747_29g122 [Trypanosoma cruzi]